MCNPGQLPRSHHPLLQDTKSKRGSSYYTFNRVVPSGQENVVFVNQSPGFKGDDINTSTPVNVMLIKFNRAVSSIIKYSITSRTLKPTLGNVECTFITYEDKKSSHKLLMNPNRNV